MIWGLPVRHTLCTLLALTLLAGAVRAQALGFDDFSWTFSGPPTSSGTVSSTLMHVAGPAYTGCSDAVAAFTTTAPFAGTVRVHLAWQILDDCVFDWPLYLVNGQVTKIPVGGDPYCFLNGPWELEFDVQAGDTFGLGVGSSDCLEGPGIADWTNFTFLPPKWVDVGGALDPLVQLDIAGEAGIKDFGLAVATIGDVDGDGLPEVAVDGSNPNIFPIVETVTLHAGADGEELWSASGPIAYGNVLVAMGDVDADGAPDVAISNRVESNVQVRSGLDGHVIWSWTWGGSAVDYYGSGLAAHADIDHDGVLELAVGNSSSITLQLPVRVFSGATGAQLKILPPGLGDKYFGNTLASAGDVDLDGEIDLMIAAYGTPNRVRVVSGATGLEILGLVPPPPSAGKWVGMRLAGTGDWNGDGVPDVAIGAPYDYPSPATGGLGTVTIDSGANEATLLIASAPAGTADFGLALAGGVDVDGDGLPELAVGASSQSGSTQSPLAHVFLLSAPHAVVLQDIVGQPGEELGHGLDWYAGAPSPLLLVGSPEASAPGHVRICDDLLHPGGAPQLAMYGKMLGGVPWTVHLDHGLPGNQAWLVFGLSAISAQFKGGVLVPAVNLLLPVALDGAGVFEAGATTPASLDPQLELWLQAWMPDAAGVAGWSATQALHSP